MNPRFIAISSGIIIFVIITIMFSIFGLNFVTGIIAITVFIFLSPIQSIKNGLMGSDSLLENMTNNKPMSKKSKKELTKIWMGNSNKR